MTKDYVNFIAMTALTDYPRDVKLHPTYGWRICNFAGEGDSQPNRKDIYENPYSAGYSFADAVMIAAGNKDWQRTTTSGLSRTNVFVTANGQNSASGSFKTTLTKKIIRRLRIRPLAV